MPGSELPPEALAFVLTGAAGVGARHALAKRMTRVVNTLLESLSEEDATLAAGAETDLDALAAALESAAFVPRTLDPETAAAYARGRAAREQLLAAEGGAVSSEELGAMLGITRQGVDKRRRAGKLLAVRPRGDWLYPGWQVANGQVLDGLEETLSTLSEGDHSAWDMLIFFVATDTAREGESPLDALRAGRVDAAVEAARMYGEQGAR